MYLCPKSTSKCLGLALNSSHRQVTSHHDGNGFFSEALELPPSGTGYRPGLTLAVMQDGSSSAQLSNVSAQKNLNEINRSPQETRSLQPKLSFILMKFMTASLFYKPASFPQKYDVFSKPYKTFCLPAERNTQRCQ